MRILTVMKFEPVMVSVERIDQRLTSALARSLRLESGLSIREVALRMGFSAAYVSDLELGRRNWSASLVEVYASALEK
jgi:transcriptional regulator with XRE-family HTH domain